jgi:energy-coupling factor transporter ATP-binding protein EcfA2
MALDNDEGYVSASLITIKKKKQPENIIAIDKRNTNVIPVSLDEPSAQDITEPIIITEDNDFTATLRDDPAKVVSEIIRTIPLFTSKDGCVYMISPEADNAFAVKLNRKQRRYIARRAATKLHAKLTSNDIKEISDILQTHVELNGDTHDVWYRVAPIENGIEIDIGDKKHTRIRVTLGKVEIITEGSETLFYRTSTMQPFVMPVEEGNLDLLKKYLNLHPIQIMLLIAWISYTLAHPKSPSTNYLLLVLLGDQGSGKSTLCKIIQYLLDPSIIGVQVFPKKQSDFVIAGQNAHVLLYDNMRFISESMSDILCIAMTGGAVSNRKLFTDDDLHALILHVAVVLNSIHPSLLGQADLADRTLQLETLPIDNNNRKSEGELMKEFEADLPKIFRGLLDYISKILTHLPTVEVTSPERMIDFVKFLAAMEQVDGVPVGVYQAEYSEMLKNTMLDSLLENTLAEAIIKLATEYPESWTGTPTKLFNELNSITDQKTRYSSDWPKNPSSLSKKLSPLKAPLLRQGIDIQNSRGEKRNITITNIG